MSRFHPMFHQEYRLGIASRVVYEPTTAALVLMGIGTAVSVAGTIASGNAQAEMESYKAAQGQQAAGQARASSQRDAMNADRTARFALSAGQNKSAASGADSLSPSTVKVEQDVAGQGEYNSMTALFNGEERARGLEQGALTDNYQGSLDKSEAQTKAIGTIASSGGSMLMKYGTPFDSGGGDATALDKIDPTNSIQSYTTN